MAQGTIPTEWQGGDENPGSLAPKPALLGHAGETKQ